MLSGTQIYDGSNVYIRWFSLASDEIYDAIIIGGGPAGCAASLHLAFHKRSVLVLDRRTSPMYFHTNSILNFASGSTYYEGRTLLHQLQGVSKAAGIRFQAANVVKVEREYPEFHVRTSKSYRTLDSSEYRCKTLLFATGTARKHPKVNGSWRLWLPVADVGNGAYYCPNCEAPLCEGKEVLVVNAGTVGSALHVANSVSRFAKSVRILMTEDAYIPIEEQDLTSLDESPFEWIRGKIKDVNFPIPGEVQSVTLTTGEKIRSNVFFVALVAEARSEVAQQIGVDVDERGNILTDKRGKTNIEGVWAAGDVRPIAQQISMATGTGNYAAVMIDNFLGYSHI
jgi:thioredoxin reductase (NADPH)